MDKAANVQGSPAAASEPSDAGADARARKAELVQRLDRTGLLAMELAEKLQKLAMRAVDRDMEVMDAAPPEPAQLRPEAESTEPVLSFARATRVVRESISLEIRMTTGARAADEQDSPGRRMGAAGRRRLRLMKEEVRKHVEQSIATHADPLEAERLMFELDEFLDEPEVEADFGALTIGQIVLNVCRDLDVKPDMTRWPETMLQHTLAAETGVSVETAGAEMRSRITTAEPPRMKLPTGVIGTPGVPPAIEMPHWSGRTPPAAAPPADGGRGRDPPPGGRRASGGFMGR